MICASWSLAFSHRSGSIEQLMSVRTDDSPPGYPLALNGGPRRISERVALDKRVRRLPQSLGTVDVVACLVSQGSGDLGY